MTTRDEGVGRGGEEKIRNNIEKERHNNGEKTGRKNEVIKADR